MVDTLPGSHPISSQEGSSLGISILGPAGGESEGPSLSDPLVSSSLGGGGKLGDAKTTVRVVKRPSTSSIGPFYSKVRIGETGQQFRIVGGQSVGNIVNIGGQPIKIVTAGAGTGAGVGINAFQTKQIKPKVHVVWNCGQCLKANISLDVFCVGQQLMSSNAQCVALLVH